ncbi:MAG: Disulfide bond formation protein B [Alphaproteobacteria bacterium MarineAlpha8_Bin1]|nr:MAG: Disulfide bond formation protein B [Alphaproteobacteria bacterium MarineAlpha8_Bin1]|tara:strand:+ start:707 stop:1192 length:486 start_codon:yes stop_codon:yes gene_type:complete
MQLTTFKEFYFHIIFLVSFLILSSVYIIEVFFDIPPCKLCIYQRIPYFIMIFANLLFIKNRFQKKFVICNIILFSLSAFVSLFHSLVERGIVDYELGCTSSNKEFSNIEDLRVFLEQVPIIKCDEILYSLFGLSFANMNFLISVFFVIISTYLLRSYARQK